MVYEWGWMNLKGLMNIQFLIVGQVKTGLPSLPATPEKQTFWPDPITKLRGSVSDPDDPEQMSLPICPSM